jgi:phage replication O-like protein O
MARALIPNSTQIPDVILDHWMAELSGAELKVLLYIARRTYGFGKDSDNISLNQIAAGMVRKDGTALNRGTGLSRSGVKVACNSLIEKGLLVRTARTAEGSREPEESTYRLNLYASLPTDAETPQSPPEGVEEVGHNLAYLGQKKAYLGRPQSGQGVGQKLALQETHVQETQTSSSEPNAEAASDADAALVERLLGEGVGRSVAIRLAREKPEVCRKCLEYLPFAQLKSTKGAWLASAIRDEYGPPQAYLKARQADEKTARAENAAALRKAREEAQDARRRTNIDRLGTLYARLKQAHGEEFASFIGFLAEERARAEKVAANLSTARREAHLATFEEPERRLELFARWLKTQPAKAPAGPESPDPAPIAMASGGLDAAPYLPSGPP